MSMTPDVQAAIEASRQEAHSIVDRSFDGLLARLNPAPARPAGTYVYNDPTDAQCRDPGNKNGHNLTPDGVEILFRLLDKGAGYNSAGRKMSITQTAVRNRKGDWERQGGAQRKKRFLPLLDAIV